MVKPATELLADCPITVAAPRTTKELAIFANDLILDLVNCNKDKQSLRDFYEEIDG